TDDRHRHEPHRVSLLDSQHLTQMEFGVHLPLISFIGERRSLDDLVAVTKTANDLDYTHICANDHLVFSRPWLDGPTALAAMVAHSGRMTLATTVAVPVLRGPAATAKILAAIDLLSGGQLLVGLGPGSSARDYELVGLSFDERWKRLEEAVQVLRAYWGDDGVAFEGTFYSSAGFTLEPKPAQRRGPPIWIGSWGSAAGLRRVARLADGWLASGYNTTPDVFGAARRRLLEVLGADRFPNTVATMWMHVTEDPARAEAVLTGVLAPTLGRPPEELRERLLVGPAGACAEKLARYAAAGAERVLVWPVGDELRQLERFRSDVAPRVAAARGGSCPAARRRRRCSTGSPRGCPAARVIVLGWGRAVAAVGTESQGARRGGLDPPPRVLKNRRSVRLSYRRSG